MPLSVVLCIVIYLNEPLRETNRVFYSITTLASKRRISLDVNFISKHYINVYLFFLNVETFYVNKDFFYIILWYSFV